MKKIDKIQTMALKEAWELHGEILTKIRDLAEMNSSFAYGCIRTAEVIIDLMVIDKLHKTKNEQPTPSSKQGEE